MKMASLRYVRYLSAVTLLLVLTSVFGGSWDSYIDNLIAQSKDIQGREHADKACIIGIDGGAMWTSNSHSNAFKLTAEERTVIARAFKSNDFSTFNNNGINAEGERYQFLRSDDNVVFGKKKGHGAITMQSSKTGIVIAHTKEGMQQGNSNKAVNVIAEYLSSLGM